MSKHKRNPRVRTAVTLRTVAERCGLAPCSVSAVLNNSPAARAIPQHTNDRVMRAVKHRNHCPNFSAAPPEPLSGMLPPETAVTVRPLF